MGKVVSFSLRVHALGLLEERVPMSKIKERTGLMESTVYRIKRRAYQQGYDSTSDLIFHDYFFADVPRSGCPRLMNKENEGK